MSSIKQISDSKIKLYRAALSVMRIDEICGQNFLKSPLFSNKHAEWDSNQ